LHNFNDGLFPDRQGGKAIASVAKSMNGNSIVEQAANPGEVREASRFTVFLGQISKREIGPKRGQTTFPKCP